MTPDAAFFEDLTVAVAAAALGGWLANRAGLNAIVGYIVAGVAIGPFTPGYVAHGHTIANLAELGLIFLLFSIGLGFSFADIVNAGARAILTGVAVTLVLAAIFWSAATMLGFPHPISLALIAVVSSTAIAAALLRDWGLDRERVGQIAIALLVSQDLAAVALLVIVATPPSSLSTVGIVLPLAKAVGFVIVALALGATVLHDVVNRLLRTAPTEALFGIFTALALVAAWLARLFGLSLDFGAFVAGAVISEAAATQMVHAIVTPFRAVFVALFFVSIGMLIDPKLIADHWFAIVVLGIGFGIVRLFGWALVGRTAGLGLRSAAFMGIAMLPLGEFNIVLANAASSAHRINEAEQAVILGAVFASILLASVAGPLAKSLRFAEDKTQIEEAPPSDAIVAIVGFGRVGQTVAETLVRCNVKFAVLERDREVVMRWRALGIQAFSGDANDPHALDHVIQDSTRVIVVATPDTTTNVAVARRYQDRKDTAIIARAARSSDAAELLEHGVASVLVPETEGALSFAAVALRNLGFSDARVDEEIVLQRKSMTAIG